MTDTRISAETIEALTNGTPESRESAVTVEVLTPAALTPVDTDTGRFFAYL